MAGLKLFKSSPPQCTLFFSVKWVKYFNRISVSFSLSNFLPMSEERYFFLAYAEKLSISTDTAKIVFSPSAGIYTSLPVGD